MSCYVLILLNTYVHFTCYDLTYVKHLLEDATKTRNAHTHQRGGTSGNHCCSHRTIRGPSPTRSCTPSPPPAMANRTVYQQATTGFTGATSPITLPNIANDRSWQIPSYIMTAITNSCQFHGRDDEDAPAHINRITCLCSTFSIEGVNLDARYLQVFPFSLAGRAAVWFDSQPAGTFRTWAGLRDAFLTKYFPPAKVAYLIKNIKII